MLYYLFDLLQQSGFPWFQAYELYNIPLRGGIGPFAYHSDFY